MDVTSAMLFKQSNNLIDSFLATILTQFDLHTLVFILDFLKEKLDNLKRIFL